MKLFPELAFIATQLQLRAAAADAAGDTLPEGVCGRLTGVCLTYNVPDDYGTIFVDGCLQKTIAERVNTGKVKLFADHGPFTHTHVGVVRSIENVGDSALMVADLFETDSGRAMKEYLEAVLASGADTGLSIGFRPHDKEWRELPPEMAAKVGGMASKDMFLFYKQIELREVSITPVPAVPGADVVSVRREQGESDEDLLKRHLASILRSLPERDARSIFDEVYRASSAATPDTAAAAEQTPAASTANAEPTAESATGASNGSELATPEQRTRAIRETYASV